MSNSSTSLTKATIINLDKKGQSPIKCMFNPKEYTVSKQNTWNQGKNTAQNVPHLVFGGGQPATLQMQLFFDTYVEGADVRQTHTDLLWKLMMVDPDLKDKKNKKGRPPKVLFQWGDSWSFEAVITSIKQQFTLFDDKGTPVRAMLDVSFQEVKDAEDLPNQNPTSHSPNSERVWTVNQGDTLAWIAYRVYGDPGAWRAIADANRLTQVRRLTPGTTLEIPNV